ncbi:6735_t:CDS:2, partial [Gigaspora rosea]
DSAIYLSVNDTTDLEKELEPSVRSQITSSVKEYKNKKPRQISLEESIPKQYSFQHQEIDPLYKPPCVKTLKSYLFEAYNKCIITLKQKILEADTVALTLDIWSSKAHDSYLGITCYWLTEDFQIQEILLKLIELPYPYGHIEIYNTVQEVIENWKLDKKITAILTDNGANVKAAIEKFDDI